MLQFIHEYLIWLNASHLVFIFQIFAALGGGGLCSDKFKPMRFINYFRSSSLQVNIVQSCLMYIHCTFNVHSNSMNIQYFSVRPLWSTLAYHGLISDFSFKKDKMTKWHLNMQILMYLSSFYLHTVSKFALSLRRFFIWD